MLIDDNFADGHMAGKLQQCMQALPLWRRRKAESYRQTLDKVLCAKAYLLLCRGLKEHYGIETMPHFVFGPSGKPYLEEYPQINFNLSHCKRGVLCVIGNGAPVGCDIEVIPDAVEPGVMRLCLNSKEQALVEQSADPCVEFTKLWTRKEALLKFTGDGLATANLTALLGNPLAATTAISTIVRRDKGYVYSICHAKQ